MTKLFFLFGSLLISIFTPMLAHGCGRDDQVQTDRLQVAYLASDVPFTYLGPNGQPQGFSADLWRAIAAEIGLDFDFVECESFEIHLAALHEGRIDVSIAPLTITEDRLRNIDFTYEYLASGVALAVRDVNQVNFLDAFGIIWQFASQPAAWRAVLLLFCLYVIVVVVLRFYGRGLSYEAQEYYTGPVRSWLFHGLEGFVRMMGLRGLQQKGRTLLGRVGELILVIVGILISGLAFGVMTSALVNAGRPEITVAPQELSEMNLAVLHCTTAQDFLRQQYIERSEARVLDEDQEQALVDFIALLSCDGGAMDLVDTQNVTQVGADLAGSVAYVSNYNLAIEMLMAGQVDGVLGDWAQLTYRSRLAANQGNFHVQARVYRNDPIAWGVSQSSQVPNIAREINGALIAHKRSPDWRRRLQGALGFGDVTPN